VDTILPRADVEIAPVAHTFARLMPRKSVVAPRASRVTSHGTGSTSAIGGYFANYLFEHCGMSAHDANGKHELARLPVNLNRNLSRSS